MQADELDLLLKTAKAVLWRADVQPLKFTYVSPQAETMLGIRIQDWFDNVEHWAQGIHPDDREESVSFCSRAAAKHEDHVFEYRYMHPDGRILWIEDTVKMVEGPHGWEMVGVMMDITARRESEQARVVRAQEELKILQGVWDTAREGVVVAEDAVILHANPTAETLLGRAPGTLVGQHLIEDLLHPDSRQRSRELLAQLKAGGGLAGLLRENPRIRHFLRPDGSVLNAEVHLAALDPARPTLLVNFISDLDSQERASKVVDAVLEAGHEAIVLVNQDGTVKRLNAAFEHLSGYSQQEALGRRLAELIVSPGEREAHLANLALVVQAGAQAGFVRFERTYVHKDGSGVPCEVHIRCLPSEPLTLLAFIRDSRVEKARVEALEAQARSQALFAAIVDHSVGLMVYFDLQEVPIYVSPSAKTILGWDPQALKALPPPQWLHPDDYPAAALRREKVVTGHLTNPLAVMRFLCADGSYKRLRTSYVKLPASGSIEGYLLHAEDAEATLHAEEQLRETESLYRSIVEHSWDLLAVVGADAAIEQASPSMVAAFEQPMESLRGLALTRLVQAEDRPRLDALLARALGGRHEHKDVDLRLGLPQGPRLYSVRLRALPDAGKGRVLFEAREIQDERDAQAQLLTYQRLAVFGQLAAGFAHEVRNPLAGIINGAQLAQRRQQSGQDSREQLEVVLRQAQRLKNLMEDVLLHAASQRQAIGLVDPCAVLDRAIETALMQFGPLQDRIKTLKDCPHGPTRVLAGEERLMRLLSNLVLNGLQALAQPGGTLQVTGRIEGGEAVLRVQDDGAGFAPGTLEHIFEPFYTTKPTGSGLGLWIAQSLANEMGARLSTEAVLPHGAAFILRIPIAGAA